MFLFIRLSLFHFRLYLQSKYISCSYLSGKIRQDYNLSLIQIHLMFLFIKAEAAEETLKKLFKYISCSYLSALFVLGWIMAQ